MKNFVEKVGVTALFALALFAFSFSQEPAQGGAGGGGGGGGGQATTPVDCNAGESIQEALDGGADTVNFFGTCTEIVTIDRDDITLAGLDPDRTQNILIGGVSVVGAQRVVIENATISNPNTDSAFLREGISLDRGAAAILRDLTITVNAREGVRVGGGSSAEIRDSMITNNTRAGVQVRDNSFARLRNLIITGNQRRGVTVTRGATVVIEDTEITNNKERGLVLFRGAYVNVSESTIKENEDEDVNLLDGSGGRIQDSVIGPSPLNNQVLGVESSNLRIDNTVINGNVVLLNHARLEGNGDGNSPFPLPRINGDVELSRASLLTHKFGSSRSFTVTGDVTCATSLSGLGVISGDLDPNGLSDGAGLDILGTVTNCTLLPKL